VSGVAPHARRHTSAHPSPTQQPVECYTAVVVSFRRFAVATILTITVAAPIVEMFDQWDHTLQDGNDTEASVVIAALCVGVALAIGTIVIVARMRFLSSQSSVATIASYSVCGPMSAFVAPMPTGSPPTPLRI